MKTLFLGILLVLSIGNATGNETVESVSKFITSNIDNKILEAGGQWEATENVFEIYPQISKLNSFYLTCDLNTSMCIEERAFIITPKEFPNFKRPRLFPLKLDYKIVTFDGAILKAENVAKAAIMTLILNLKLKTLCLTSTQREKDKDGMLPKPSKWCSV
jgi:hypothetical protein